MKWLSIPPHRIFVGHLIIEEEFIFIIVKLNWNVISSDFCVGSVGFHKTLVTPTMFESLCLKNVKYYSNIFKDHILKAHFNKGFSHEHFGFQSYFFLYIWQLKPTDFLSFSSCYILCLLRTFPVRLHVVSTSYVSGSVTFWVFFIRFRLCYILYLLHTFPVVLHFGSLTYVFGCAICGSTAYFFGRAANWVYLIRFRLWYTLGPLHTFLVVLHVGFTSYISGSVTCSVHFIRFRSFYMLVLLHTFSVVLHVGSTL